MPVLKTWTERVLLLPFTGSTTLSLEIHVIPSHYTKACCSYETLWTAALLGCEAEALPAVVGEVREHRAELCVNGNFETVKEMSGCRL